jgi:hypothetical protein
MRNGKEFWIVEFKSARPAEYVMASGELTFLSLLAKRFDSCVEARAAIADWGLSAATWGATRRISPGTSTRHGPGTPKLRV